MALAYRTVYKNCYYLHCITKPVKWSVGKSDTFRVLAGAICSQNSYFHRPLFEAKQINLFSTPLRQYCTKQGPNEKLPPAKKEGLLQKIKQMYKDYWYVLVPVHMATSCLWFGTFYYTVRSGIDVLGLLQSLGISETILTPLRESNAGYFALALALYKLVTPFRYAVTAGVTTYAIRKLQTVGWIKPVPSRERLKELYQEKKVNIQDRFNESKQHYHISLKDKRSKVMEEMKRYKTEIRNVKNKVKKT